MLEGANLARDSPNRNHIQCPCIREAFLHHASTLPRPFSGMSMIGRPVLSFDLLSSFVLFFRFVIPPIISRGGERTSRWLLQVKGAHGERSSHGLARRSSVTVQYYSDLQRYVVV